MTKEEYNQKLDVFIGELQIAARDFPFAEVVVAERTDIYCQIVFESMIMGRRSFITWYDKKKEKSFWGEQ